MKAAVTIEVVFRIAGRGWRTANLEFAVPAGCSPPAVDQPALPEFHAGAPAGTVSLAFDIDREGDAENIRVVRSANDLDDAAVASVRKWRFHPEMKDGQPIAASGSVDLTFEP